ncbi:MAG TPA: MarR family transcriptional regulator [Candidatus Dormibacteraeota bacterium]|jgi:DNA-binding MarR family transcriptional regulator
MAGRTDPVSAAAREGIRRRARMRMLFRRAVALVDRLAVEEGLSPAQYHVLLTLAARAGDGGLPESALVRHLDASRAHVSAMVRSLHAAGLTMEWRDADDRRQLRLAVADTGWQLLERLGERQEQVLRDFVAGFDRTEVEEIVADISARYLGLNQG